MTEAMVLSMRMFCDDKTLWEKWNIINNTTFTLEGDISTSEAQFECKYCGGSS